ncbi:MAG: hypothetical protein M1814_004376 [Vezdaea aestivalis]|nr:MAG: hypothetical protein M1814_004376 [Vezdaea aestivalis]
MGRESECRSVLEATRDTNVDDELRGIKRAVKYEFETSGANHYWAMLFPKDRYSRQLRWRVVLAVWLQIMQELVGIGVITVYAVDLFKTAGFSEELSKLLAGFNDISYMFSVVFAVITLDRYGRRSTMVWGAVGMALTMLTAGICDKFASEEGNPNQRAYGSATAAFTFLYTAIFDATWLTTPWLYPTEIFPLNVRAKGGAWLSDGALCYFLLCGLNIFCIPFVILMYPETAGRSLDYMDTFFEHGGSWNVFRASHNIHENGIADWRWTKKLSEEAHRDIESGRRESTARTPEEDEKDARMSWTKRPLYTVRRKRSNAGIM